MRRLSILIPILLLVSMAEAHVQLERIIDRRIVMGVECRITVYAPSEAEARAATRDAFERMETIERAISSWRPGSEASRLQQRVGEEVELTPELFELLWRSLLWAKRSDGAFDPTFGALIATWRDARNQERVPSQEAIERAQDHSGWQHVELDLGRRSAKITQEGLQLDFGGIGKGFAADQALNVLRKHGLPSAIIEIGGDVVAGDPPPGTNGWTVDIEPAPEEFSSSRLLANGAMATSGDVEQFFEVDGKRYSHIIDPKSGIALTSRVQVTAIVRGGVSPGADADSLASAASVRAAEGGDLASLLEGIPGAELLVFNAEDLTVGSWGPTPAGAISGGRELKVVFDEAEFTEGPVATPTGEVYFTDQPNDRIMRIATDGEVTQFAQPSFRANGLAVDENGAIWACADNENQLIRFDPDGKIEVVLDEGLFTASTAQTTCGLRQIHRSTLRIRFIRARIGARRKNEILAKRSIALRQITVPSRLLRAISFVPTGLSALPMARRSLLPTSVRDKPWCLPFNPTERSSKGECFASTVQTA